MGCHHPRYVVLAVRDGFDPALAAEVRKDLAAELGPRGYGVCAARAAEGELAAEIGLSMPEPALVSIQIDDLVTGKRVWRDVPLTRIPAGGSALAIAIAADELLRASWAELDLPRREAREEGKLPAGTGPAGETVQGEPAGGLEDAERRTVNARASPGAAAPRSRRPSSFLLGALPNYVSSPQAWNAFGAELRAQGVLRGWGWLEAGLGGFGTLAVQAASAPGSVRASGLSASLSGGACSAERARLRLCGGARGGYYWMQFRGDASAEGARGRKQDLSALTLSGVGQLGVRISQRFLALFELTLGGAALGALAKHEGTTLLGLDGFVFTGAAGLGFQP